MPAIREIDPIVATVSIVTSRVHASQKGMFVAP